MAIEKSGEQGDGPAESGGVRSLVTERVRALQGYEPGEQPVLADLCKLNTNENPYPPAPSVISAIADEAARGLARYPSAMSDPLREKAAEVYGVRPEQVLAGNGSDEVLALCLRACVEPGAAVSWAVPGYSLYRTLTDCAGGRAVEVSAEPGDLPLALLDGDPAVTFLCNPRAPFGDAQDLDSIRQFCRSARGLVVVDEAYIDFGGTTAMPLLEEFPNVCVTRSFSKSFSLAGLRLGLIFGHPDFLAQLAKIKDSYNVSRLGVAAGVAALEDYGWMENNVVRVRATRARMIAGVRRAGYDALDSAGNFFWMDCSHRSGPVPEEEPGGRVVYEQLRAEGVLVRWFDQKPLRQGVRVSVGTDDEADRFLTALVS